MASLQTSDDLQAQASLGVKDLRLSFTSMEQDHPLNQGRSGNAIFLKQTQVGLP